MAIVRWDPARELSSIQHEMNRLFDTFFQPAGTANGNRTGAGQPRWVPAMDLVEDGDHFVLRADLPGVAEDDVAIELDGDVLTVSGTREAVQESGEGQTHRVERAYGTFRRSLTLPEGVDPDMIEAHFDRGVLEVRVPKPEERKPRRVAISVGGGEPKTLEGSESQA